MKLRKKLVVGCLMTACSASLISGWAADKYSALEAKNLTRARDLIGMNIKNPQDETVGEVKDLVVDLPAGRVRYAVVSSSTLFGGKLATMPPEALARSADEKHLVLSMDRDKLKGAPTFDSEQWPNMSDPDLSRRVYGYYGIAPGWRGEDSTLHNSGDRSNDRTADKAVDRSTRQELKSMAKYHKGSEVLGMKVENPQNDNLGDLQDFVVDLHSGHIVYAVLASGGFLGIGEKYLAIPPKAFQVSTDGKHLALNVDKEKLKAAPGFDKNNWPQMADQNWTQGVYTYYGQEPYWNSDRAGRNTSDRDYTGTQADNTRKNVRDRDGNTVTPPDQGSSESDRTVTQEIRRAITKDDTFSTDAHNVKIMTMNGAVTLRGVVKSQAEKDQIEAKAKVVAGVTRVDNQLEVKQ